jgi:hypothetical protein
MSTDEIKATILKLPATDRARLAEGLLQSLEQLSTEESARSGGPKKPFAATTSGMQIRPLGDPNRMCCVTPSQSSNEVKLN